MVFQNFATQLFYVCHSDPDPEHREGEGEGEESRYFALVVAFLSFPFMLRISGTPHWLRPPIPKPTASHENPTSCPATRGALEKEATRCSRRLRPVSAHGQLRSRPRPPGTSHCG